MKEPGNVCVYKKGLDTLNFEYIIRRIRQSPQFTQAVLELERDGKRIDMSGLSGSRRAFWTAALVGGGYPAVVVCSSEANARELFEDLKSFSGRAYYYPSLQPVLYNDMVHSMEAEWSRISALDALVSGDADIVVAAVEALMFPVMPPARYRKYTLFIQAGQSPGMENVIKGLTLAGYEREDLTEGPGQFSVRGGILDVFPVGELSPYRLEFFGDQVESIRLMDTDTQRSVEKVDAVRVPPCRELVMEPREGPGIVRNMDADLDKTVKRLKASGQGRRAAELKEETARVKEAILTGAGSRFLGSYHMYGCQTADFSEYLAGNHLVVLDNSARVLEAAAVFHADFLSHYTDRLERGAALCRQQHKVLSPAQLESMLVKNKVVGITDILKGKGTTFHFSTRSMDTFYGKLPLFAKEVARLKRDGYLVCIMAGSGTRLNILEQELKKEDLLPVVHYDTADRDFLDGEVVLDTGGVKEGFLFPQAKLAVFSDRDIFGASKKRLKPLKRTKTGIEILPS